MREGLFKFISMYFPRDYRAKYFFQSERDRAQVNLDWNCDEFLKINSSQAGGKGKRGTAGVCIDEKR